LRVGLVPGLTLGRREERSVTIGAKGPQMHRGPEIQLAAGR
jgi:hypothetical protein